MTVTQHAVQKEGRVTYIWNPTWSGDIKAWIVYQLGDIISDTSWLTRSFIFCSIIICNKVQLLLMLINVTEEIYRIKNPCCCFFLNTSNYNNT